MIQTIIGLHNTLQDRECLKVIHTQGETYINKNDIVSFKGLNDTVLLINKINNATVAINEHHIIMVCIVHDFREGKL